MNVNAQFELFISLLLTVIAYFLIPYLVFDHLKNREKTPTYSQLKKAVTVNAVFWFIAFFLFRFLIANDISLNPCPAVVWSTIVCRCLKKDCAIQQSNEPVVMPVPTHEQEQPAPKQTVLSVVEEKRARRIKVKVKPSAAPEEPCISEQQTTPKEAVIIEQPAAPKNTYGKVIGIAAICLLVVMLAASVVAYNNQSQKLLAMSAEIEEVKGQLEQVTTSRDYYKKQFNFKTTALQNADKKYDALKSEYLNFVLNNREHLLEWAIYKKDVALTTSPYGKTAYHTPLCSHLGGQFYLFGIKEAEDIGCWPCSDCHKTSSAVDEMIEDFKAPSILQELRQNS